MKNKRWAALAIAGAVAILSVGGAFAVKTVMAAEEQVTIMADTSDTALQAMADVEIRKVYKNTFYGDTGCTMVLPAGYVASEDVKGMYLAGRYPMDSSNIYYTVSEEVDADVIKEAIATDDYKKRMEERFKENYGESAVISSYCLTKTEISGCPAYQIELSCQVDEMQMDQLIYVIIADKVYTITYSQSADDERMEEFKKSAETINIVFQA